MKPSSLTCSGSTETLKQAWCELSSLSLFVGSKLLRLQLEYTRLRKTIHQISKFIQSCKNKDTAAAAPSSLQLRIFYCNIKHKIILLCIIFNPPKNQPHIYFCSCFYVIYLFLNVFIYFRCFQSSLFFLENLKSPSNF